MPYREWTDEAGILHIEPEHFDCFDWITPEFMDAIDRGDLESAKAIAGIT